MPVNLKHLGVMAIEKPEQKTGFSMELQKKLPKLQEHIVPERLINHSISLNNVKNQAPTSSLTSDNFGVSRDVPIKKTDDRKQKDLDSSLSTLHKDNDKKIFSNQYSPTIIPRRTTITLLERLVKTNHIWFLQHLDRDEVAHLLISQPRGVSYKLESSQCHYFDLGSFHLVFTKSISDRFSLLGPAQELDLPARNPVKQNQLVIWAEGRLAN